MKMIFLLRKVSFNYSKKKNAIRYTSFFEVRYELKRVEKNNINYSFVLIFFPFSNFEATMSVSNTIIRVKKYKLTKIA